MNIRIGESSPLSVKGKTVDGLVIDAVLYAAVNNTTPAYSDYDTTKINCKTTLKRAGSELVICSGVITPLMMDSCFLNKMFQSVSPMQGYTVPIQTAAAAVKGIVLINGFIDFGGPINVKSLDGQIDELEAIIDVNTNAFTSAVDTNLSLLEVDFRETVGVEWQTPILRSRAVQQNESDFQLSLGSKVLSVSVINLDKADTQPLSVNAVATRYQLNSDKFTVNDTPRELWTKRELMFNAALQQSSPVFRGQSFLLYRNSVPLNDAEIIISFDPTQIATGKNYIVWRSFTTSKSLALRAAEMQAKHNAENNVTAFS